MSFIDLQNFSTPPNRVCNLLTGSILEAFPPKDIAPHDRLGYSFRSEPCNSVEFYEPDVCVSPTGVPKMDPDEFGEEKEAELRVVQAAFKCSTVGATDAELRTHATWPIERNLWRSVDATLVDILQAEATAEGGPFEANCLATTAAQFLATNSFCGTGVIYGSVSWFLQLDPTRLIKSGKTYKDFVGNIIVPSSIDLNVVYAFDSTVEIRTSDIQLLDEYSPGIRTVNDRIVRAEMVYTVALDNCVAGSFILTDCA